MNKESIWKSPYGDGDPDSFSFKRDPYHLEDCAYVQRGEVHSTYCATDFKQCAACMVVDAEHRHRFELKGLCREETELRGNFDTKFYIDGFKNSVVSFRGIAFGNMFYDDSVSLDGGELRSGNATVSAWRITSYRAGNSVSLLLFPGTEGETLRFLWLKACALLMCSHFSDSLYPFGRRKWRVSVTESSSAGGGEICGRRNGEEITLTFSRCFPEMFTCNNGDCISLR